MRYTRPSVCPMSITVNSKMENKAYTTFKPTSEVTGRAIFTSKGQSSRSLGRRNEGRISCRSLGQLFLWHLLFVVIGLRSFLRRCVFPHVFTCYSGWPFLRNGSFGVFVCPSVRLCLSLCRDPCDDAQGAPAAAASETL